MATTSTMKTTHEVIPGDARNMQSIEDEHVQLVVTSPPYPMISMWDDTFRSMSGAAAEGLERDAGLDTFEAMHVELDRVWQECHRVLAPGGFICINIGDATRSIGGDFRLFHNHARIVSAMVELGFHVLPDILWRKPTNAPNKFMGSGMLPAGAYVTYEHEYILVFRKGGKRVFATPEQRENRLRSAFFWEERNAWFSDVWESLTGTKQRLDAPNADRKRSGAFPFELPYRLVNMYSVYGDVVLDPFVGTGTTLAAAVTAGRSSLGMEVSTPLAEVACKSIEEAACSGCDTVLERLENHRAFVETRQRQNKTLKHHNEPHDVPVMTSQEKSLCLVFPRKAEQLDTYRFSIEHERIPGPAELTSVHPEPSRASMDPPL